MSLKKTLLPTLLLASTILFASNKNLNLTKDVFGTRVFQENKGQFKPVNNSSDQVKFVYESGAEHIYFTDKGVVHKLIKKFPLTEEQRERLEDGKKIRPKRDEIYFVNMTWLNANENIEIVESKKQDYYITYGGPEWNSYGYKKITYKNVYNNIDIEYTLPDDKEHGIKYNVILHPGANPNDIKISYSGDVDKIELNNGEITIQTPLEDIVEYAPKSFYEDNKSIASEFKLENKIISFQFPGGYDINKTVIIDPFVLTLLPLTSTNFGFDVDYDYLGNLYVYGGLNLNKVAKYNSGGVLQWVFSGSLPLVPWSSDGDISTSGNFIVNKVNNKIYVGTGFEFAGTRTIRLDALGNYDNFVTTPIGTWRELWDMGFHCGTSKVYGLGGGTFGNNNAGLIDQITGTVTSANFTGLPNAQQDIVSNAIDDNGNVFVYFAGPNVNNKILRVNPGFNGNIWYLPSTYTTFNEADNKSSFIGAGFPAGTANGFNCLAVNNTYMFFYDGFNLAAYDKNTGIKIGFTTIAGLTVKRQGGIAVDDCNNVYVGGNGNILCYNFNGATFNPLPNIPLGVGTPSQYVYDIKIDKNVNLLYFTGSGFIGTKVASASLGCGGTNQFAITSNCVGNNNGTGVATVTTSIPNPLIDYIWTGIGGTVSATMGSSLTTNTVTNLPNGTYTIQMQINAPCGPVYVNTITINCCSAYQVNPVVTQVGCTGTVNAVSITVVGAGTLLPTFTWSPVPGALAGNSLSATGLPVGITTITSSYGNGCFLTTTVNMLPAPPPVTFTLNNLTGSYSITCTNPAINLAAVSNYTYGALSYSWTSPSFTAGTSTVSIVQTNTLTITVFDALTGCLSTQTVAIGTDTAAPTTSVAPASQVITCNSAAPVTFSGTVTSPTINIQHDWYSPINPLPAGVPIATSNNTIGILSGFIPPGTYTLVTTNLVNGCKTMKTVTITSLDAFPTYSLFSPTNYSIGCSPLQQTTISIINPVSTQTPPSICSYTFLPPGFAGTVNPGIPLGNNTSTFTQIPGTWTVIVQDNSNFCRTIISVPIIQNTVAPNVAATILQQTLTCYQPTLLATGTSSTPNTIIQWQVPSTPPLLSTPTVVIGDLANGPNSSTTSLTYANFTVIATNTINGCQSSSVVVINQNFKPPVSSPTISIGTPTAIYCTVGTAPVVLTTGSSTTTSGGGPLAFPIPLLWEGPSPQATMTGVSSYSCYVAGVYTLTIKDNYNGCTKTGTVNVLDKTQPPVLVAPSDSSILDCGANQANLYIAVSGTTTGLKYWYYTFPIGTAFSPSAAPIPNGANPYFSGTTSPSVAVSMPGFYQYVVTNTLTGCRAFGSFTVNNGGITANFTPDNYTGYAPLLVNFTNNSSTSLGTSSITSIWSFGNGTSQTTTTNINTSTTYTAPGSYTVLLLTSRGTCVDTAYKVIKVDMPSKLEAPNVFTPNGDGSNDVFFLKTANLGELTALIFDRWGNKVYDVTSSSGNIGWDGKNLQGKECAAGVYFYIVKAKGNDGVSYETKGNVSLFR